MMGAGKSLLIEVSQAVGLDDEAALFKALGELGRKWVDLAGDVDGFGSAAALLRAVADGASDESVSAAFTKLGAEGELAELKKGADKLKSLLDKVPDTIAKLLEPIGKYDEQGGATKDLGVIRWPLIEKSLAKAGGGDVPDKPSYSLSLQADAALIIEAGDSWPYSDPMPGPLLRMRAEGGLKPTASATLPFSAGAATASAGASVHCALEYYFAAENQRSLYALAICERIGGLPDPFDYDSVWDAFSGSDLAGLHYEFDGKAAANVSISVADSTALGSLLTADLGAKVSVGVQLGGKFFLTFRKGPRGANGEPQIIAALSRERSKAADLGLKLGVTIDLSALAKRVHAVLGQALGKWDEVLGEVKPYLSPGTWIQEKAGSLLQQEANKLVKDPALRAALVRDLQGVIGIGDPEDLGLVEWMSGQLGGAIDAAEGWARDRASAAVSATNVLGRNLPAFAQIDLKPKLQASAEKLIGHAADELKKQVDGLFAKKKAELGKALHGIGAAADKKVKDADAALESVRSLIDRYDRLFRKVVAATEDAARAKISAAIQIEESRQSSATLELTGTFLARSDRARAVFHSLTRGDFRSLLKLVETGGAGTDFALDVSKSKLGRYAGSKSQFGMEVVLFGFGVTGSELLSSEASVIVDGTGKVQVDAKAMLEKRFSGLDADREIELVSSFSLVGARVLDRAGAPPAAERGIGLSISMGHVDEALKRQEVERFVGSLVTAGMIDRGALTRAQSTFTSWAGTPGSNGKISGALLVKLILDRPSLSALLGLDAVSNSGALPDARRRQIVRAAFERLREASSTDRSAIDASIAFLALELRNQTLDDLLADPRRTRKALTIRLGNIPQLAREHEVFEEVMRLSQGIYEMIEQLRAIYFSTPETQADSSDSTWSPKDYRNAERDAVKAVGGWLQLNNVLFWTNSKVHPRTLAFIDTLATLGRVDLASNLSLVMWRTDAGPETVVLSPMDG